MSTATISLYEADFYGWIQRQVAMLRGRDFAKLDLDNLIEEVESMGKSEKRELESRLEVLLMHLLKWLYQPERRGASWQLTIKGQRDRITDHISDNPSLKDTLSETYDRAYRYAVTDAALETGLGKSTFPAECPWTFEQAMDDNFWPDAVPATNHSS